MWLFPEQLLVLLSMTCSVCVYATFQTSITVYIIAGVRYEYH
jgi:hypothetical protein